MQISVPQFCPLLASVFVSSARIRLQMDGKSLLLQERAFLKGMIPVVER
jgi:hypothetical protein